MHQSTSNLISIRGVIGGFDPCRSRLWVHTGSVTGADGEVPERRASWLELFFDLVLVAAVAGLAAQLDEDHSVTALAVFAGLFVTVWWAWWGFTWYSAAFNTDDPVNRIGLLAGMAAVAGIVVGIPGAAHGDSDTFVIAYAVLLAILAALYAHAYVAVPVARPLSIRYFAGDVLGAAISIGSLALDEGVRPFAWALAMVVLMSFPVWAAASLHFRSSDAAHIAERYGLFTLIVLGESVAGTIAGLDTGSSVAAVAAGLWGLVIAAAVWWLYFDRWQGMPAGSVRSGAVWAQGHFFVFAGIAAAAVGVEHGVQAAARGEPLTLADRLPLGTGLAGFLLAMAAIRAATRSVDRIVALRVAAAALVAAFALVGIGSAQWFVAASALVMVCECAIDLRIAPPPARPQPPPLPHELLVRRGR
jgi:low temperature requirement protein LtrA